MPVRAVRTWHVIPQVVQHRTHVELRIGTRHLRCQECKQLGRVGKPDPSHQETDLDSLHHL